MLAELAVEAAATVGRPGRRVRVRLVTADPATRTVRFTAVGDRPVDSPGRPAVSAGGGGRRSRATRPRAG
ncbi:hypothetical protein [Modestobacter sp. SYSU DS0511]